MEGVVGGVVVEADEDPDGLKGRFKELDSDWTDGEVVDHEERAEDRNETA